MASKRFGIGIKMFTTYKTWASENIFKYSNTQWNDIDMLTLLIIFNESNDIVIYYFNKYDTSHFKFWGLSLYISFIDSKSKGVNK